MIKICHLTSVHSRTDTRVFIKECSSLAKFGYEVTLLVADGKENEVKNGVAIISVNRIPNTFLRMINTPSLLYKKAQQIDAEIYHLHDPELLPIGLKLKRLKKKVIFDSHENVVKQIMTKAYLNKITGFLVSKIYEMYERFAMSKLDAIITTSPRFYDKFVKWHPNVCMVNNYPILGELVTKNPKQKSATNILYLGGITKIRGILELIQAVALCKRGVRLKLAGPFFSESFRQEAIKTKGWEWVDELGVLNRKQIAEIMVDSSIGMVTLLPTPNHVDALPVKMFEYMSASLPVISSNFSLWKSYIDECHCGICVNPLDPAETANAIDYLVANPEKAAEMGKNGQNNISTKYNWLIEEQLLLKCYKNIL